MLFNSLQFLLFFPVVTILYFLLPYRFRWFHLLVASCVFYAAFIPAYLLILLTAIIIDYLAARWIEDTDSLAKKKSLLIVSIVSTCMLLFFFKYYNFVTGNVNALAHLIGWNYSIKALELILPIGLSFHTFQSLSYVIEVYRGKFKAERHFGIYSLYVMFYPQLVAGPIERPQNVLHQFYEKHDFNYDRVVSGLRMMAWGLFMKIVVADRLSLYVNAVYNNMPAYKGFPLIFGTFFFCFQIYCDFAGYSSIALGSAKVIGFDLMVNFRMPYLAPRLTEFWRRWHISLYSWFNDYIYTPFTTHFRDWGLTAIILGIMLIFSLSGLWHGAAWTYVLWGVWHGLGLSVETLSKKPLKKIRKNTSTFIYDNISRIITLLFLFISFMLFRAKNFSDIVYFFKNIFHFDKSIIGVPIFTKNYFVTNFILIGFIILSDIFLEKKLLEKLPFKTHINYSYLFFFAVCLSIYFLGIFEEQSFLYFQF